MPISSHASSEGSHTHQKQPLYVWAPSAKHLCAFISITLPSASPKASHQHPPKLTLASSLASPAHHTHTTLIMSSVSSPSSPLSADEEVIRQVNADNVLSSTWGPNSVASHSAAGATGSGSHQHLHHSSSGSGSGHHHHSHPKLLAFKYCCATSPLNHPGRASPFSSARNSPFNSPRGPRWAGCGRGLGGSVRGEGLKCLQQRLRLLIPHGRQDTRPSSFPHDIRLRVDMSQALTFGPTSCGC